MLQMFCKEQIYIDGHFTSELKRLEKDALMPVENLKRRVAYALRQRFRERPAAKPLDSGSEGDAGGGETGGLGAAPPPRTSRAR